MITLRLLLMLALMFPIFARADAGASFDAALREGRFAEASSLLAQFPPGGPDRGTAIEKMLLVLPLLPWSAETAQMWGDCTAAIEGETNAYWGTRNLGGLLGAVAVPNVPRNAAIAAILDRAMAASRQWAGQGAPLVVSKGLIWDGEFRRAFAPYPARATPEPLVEFALETLADRPELGRQDALWALATGHIGDNPLAAQKAVHALAFSGRLDQALAIAAQQADGAARVRAEVQAARYARYGGHEQDFVRAMGVAGADLPLLPTDASALPVLRDLLEETDAPPIPALPDSFWKSVESWAAALPGDQSPTADAEIAGASAWAGRPDAAALLPTLAGTPWQDSARMRVACGWLWNGKRELATQCAAAIKDPEWRARADGEMAYLTKQLAAPGGAK